MASKGSDGLAGVRRVARAARRRLWLDLAWRALSRSLAVGAVVFALLVAAERGAVISIRPLWLGVGLLAAAIGVGGGVAIRRRVTALRAAGEVDRLNGLQDRLRNGLELSGAPGPFAALARRDASAAASRARTGLVRGPRSDGWTWLAVGAASSGVLLATLAPRRTPEAPAPQRQVDPEAVARAASAPEILRDAGWTREEAESAAFEAAREIEEELAAGRDAEEALAAASSTLDDRAEALEEELRQAERDAERRADRLRESETPEAEATREVWERLANEDPESALGALEALRERAEQMSDAERERLADELRELADAVDTRDAPAPGPNAEEQPLADEDPWQDALDATADEIDPTPEPRSETGPRERVDEQAAPDEAPSASDSPADPDASEGIEPESTPPPQRDEAPTRDEGKNPAPSRESDEGQETPQNAPSDAKENGSRSSERQTQPDESDSQSDGQDALSPRRDGRDTEPSETPAEGERESTEPARETEPSTQGQPDASDGEPNGAPHESAPSDAPSSASPSDDGSATEGARDRGNARDPGSADEAVERVRRQMEERRSRERDAERLREMSRRLTGRDEPQGDGGLGAGEPGEPPREGVGPGPDASDRPLDSPRESETGEAPFETDVMDARSEDDLGAEELPRTVAEWLSAPEDGGGDATGSARAPAGSRRAIERARDALEAQPPPARYRDVVKRVFDRYGRRLDAPASDGSTPSAPRDAADAPRPAPESSGGD